MFTDNLNSCCIERSNFDNTIIYNDDDHDEDTDGLDLYPVKEDDLNGKQQMYKNSEVLHFESINLPTPPPPNPPPPPLSSKLIQDFKTPLITPSNRHNGSTAIASRTKHLLPHINTSNVYSMTMPFPPSNSLTSTQYNKLKQQNVNIPNFDNNSFTSDDTDSSIAHTGGPCCAGSLKFMKWTPSNANSLHKFKQKLNSTSLDSIKKRNEAIENDLLNRLTTNTTDVNSSRKVKFQMK